MPRTLVYWEEKLASAEAALGRFQQDRLRYKALLRRALFRLKRWKSLDTRREQRLKIELYRRYVGRCARKIRQLTTTKIPYYKEQIRKGPKSSWDRLRTGDGLSL